MSTKKNSGKDSDREQKKETIRSLQQHGHIGFDNLPQQLMNRIKLNGFTFNIMCVGETGLGKTTLMETMFNACFNTTSNFHFASNVKLSVNNYELIENNVHLRLTIYETVGFGDQIDKYNSFKVIVDHIDEQYDKYLKEELQPKRFSTNFRDQRIHVCLYFLSPSGHGVKSIDLECLKNLSGKVNIIPLIAKADTLTKAELQPFKLRIKETLKRNQIQIYKFPTEDEALVSLNASMNEQIPFAVVGCTEFVEINGRRVRGRQYPWGTIVVENELHSDFIKLREMLLRTNMENLREVTHTKHYELFRQKRLHALGCCDVGGDNKPVSYERYFQFKHNALIDEMKTKEEELQNEFKQRVKIKEIELKCIEQDMHLKYEKFKKELNKQENQLRANCLKLEEDLKEFINLKKQFVHLDLGSQSYSHSMKKHKLK